MAFKEGNTGKPKGAKNKNTEKVREAFAQLVADNVDNLQADLDGLTKSQRVKMVIELAKYVLPTMKAIEIENKPISERPSWIDELLENEIT